MGALESILIDPDFEHARETFCRSHCLAFNPKDDENSLVHTSIFSNYTRLVEGTIEAELKAKVPGFEMSEFVHMIQTRRDQLMSEVFDLLLSMADFETFRDLMHLYKEEREEEMETPQPSPDPFTVDSGKGEEVSSPSGLGGKRGKGGLRVSVQGLKVHSEEQEDGEERPDLDGFALTISSPQGTRPK